MRRALLAALASFVVACGGARGPKTPDAPSDTRERDACAGDVAPKESGERPARSALAEDLLGSPIARVDFAGWRAESVEAMRSLVGLRPGAPLDRPGVAAAIRALWATGRFEDVQVSVESTDRGVIVTFLVRERPRVGRLFAPKVPDQVRAEMARALGVEPGSVLDVADLWERRRALSVGMAARGITVDVRLHDAPNNETDVCLVVGEGAPSAEDRVREWEGRSR